MILLAVISLRTFGDQKLRAREQPVPKDKSLPAKINLAFGKLKVYSVRYKIKNPD